MIDWKKDAAGEIKNFVSESELDNWVSYFKKTSPVEVSTNQCYGIDENNTIHYMWFYKIIYSRIQEIFGKDVHLQFGMYLNENNPWGVHTDAYHTEPFLDRLPAISMLIPYSVAGKKELVNKSRTIIFNERLDKNDFSLLGERCPEKESALDLYQQHLSHNKKEIIEKLTVLRQFSWSLGSLIYWDSRLLHDSDNFIANGYRNKQAIVIHTYTKLNG